MTDPRRDGFIQAISAMDRSAGIELVAEVPLQFRLHHPQGLVRADGRWWLSTVHIDAAEGHLLGFDDAGVLVSDITLTDGPRFHPGGIDVIDGVVVVPVAEYRPDSTTALVRVDLTRERAEVVGRVDDHVGALSTPRPDGTTTAMTWGSRRVLTLDHAGAIVRTRPNPSHWVDVQDLQRLDDHRLLCTGVSYLIDGTRIVALGGFGVWDEDVEGWALEVPLATTSASGRILTNNPVWMASDTGTVLLHAVPDDDTGSLLTHRLRPSGG